MSDRDSRGSTCFGLRATAGGLYHEGLGTHTFRLLNVSGGGAVSTPLETKKRRVMRGHYVPVRAT